MKSCDTNVLLYYVNQDCPEHEAAYKFITAHWNDDRFALCELVLVELYILVRNPSVVQQPLSAAAAVDLIEKFRSNPSWAVVDYPGGLMPKIWEMAGRKNFARRNIIDARLALTLIHYGVTDFVTRNAKDFKGYSFKNVRSLW